MNIVPHRRRVLTRSLAMWLVYAAGALELIPHLIAYANDYLPHWLSIAVLLLSPLGRVIDQGKAGGWETTPEEIMRAVMFFLVVAGAGWGIWWKIDGRVKRARKPPASALGVGSAGSEGHRRSWRVQAEGGRNLRHKSRNGSSDGENYASDRDYRHPFR